MVTSYITVLTLIKMWNCVIWEN